MSSIRKCFPAAGNVNEAGQLFVTQGSVRPGITAKGNVFPAVVVKNV